MRVLGYVRVSTDEQSSSGAGLEAQRHAIVAECERRGWHLVEVIEDAGFSAKDLKRPGVQEALGRSRPATRRARGGEARPALALDDRLHRADGDGAEAALGARRARLRRRHDDAGGRGDGEHARDVRAVRAAADLAADAGGARGEEGAGREARAAADACLRPSCGRIAASARRAGATIPHHRRHSEHARASRLPTTAAPLAPRDGPPHARTREAQLSRPLAILATAAGGVARTRQRPRSLPRGLSRLRVPSPRASIVASLPVALVLCARVLTGSRPYRDFRPALLLLTPAGRCVCRPARFGRSRVELDQEPP